MIKYQTICESLKSIHSCEDHKSFVNLFLRSFEFPEATIKRLELNHNDNNSITYLKNKVLFISTDKLALNVEMERKKSDYINNFNLRFILFFNKNEIFSFDTKTNESLKTSKRDFYNYFDFFQHMIIRLSFWRTHLAELMWIWRARQWCQTAWRKTWTMKSRR